MKTTRTAVLLLVTAATPLLAGEAKIPIYQGTTITTPGHYILTRDFAPPIGPGGPALTILADGVTVDVNGHRVSGQAPDPCIQISGQAGLSDGVTLFGGTISDCQDGIHLAAPDRRHVILADLTITDIADAAVLADNVGSVEARRITIRGAAIGFDLTGPGPASGIPSGILVADSMIEAQTGIRCTDVTCDLRDNLFTIAGSAIRLVRSKGSRASNNKTINCPVCFNPQPEPPARIVSVEDSIGVRILNNSLHGDPTPNGDNHGIYVDSLSHDAVVCDNTVQGVGDDGIRLLSGNSWIMGNLANGNGGDGLHVEGSNNLISTNKVAGNGGDGLHVVGMHGYTGNWLIGNGNPLGGTGVADLVDGGGNYQ